MNTRRTGWATAVVISALALALASTAGCGGLGTVRYEGDEAKRGGLGRDDVAVYVLDCADGLDVACSYQGQPLPWRVSGVFRVPPKALGKWELYREKVRDRAVQVGCRAIGVRRAPPPPYKGSEEPIGALCLDVTSAAAPPVSPGAFGAPPTTAPAPPAHRCTRDVDCARGQSCLHDVCK